MRTLSDFHNHFVILAQGCAAVKQVANMCFRANPVYILNTKHGKVNTIFHAYDATELFVCKLNKCMLPLQAIVRSLQPQMQHALAAILCIVEVLQQMHSFDESHNMLTDIAGCISLGSTNIVSRVPYFIDGCRVSKLGDK